MQRTSVQKQKKSKKMGGFSMFKKMKHMKNEKGLTLIELLAVIVILAIIAAIAIPAIGNIINNSKDRAILSDVSGMVSAAKIAHADGSCTVNTSNTVCSYSSTAADNQLAFKTTKFDLGTVTFEGDKIFITTDLIAADFKGSKKGTYDDIIGKRVTETGLNSLMEDGSIDAAEITTIPTP